MTLTRARRRLTARAFLALALLAVLGATWLPCTQALAGDMHGVMHHAHHCGHCPDGAGAAPDGMTPGALPHCVDVTRGSPDARGAVAAVALAIVPSPLLLRLEPERLRGASIVPESGPPPRARSLHLEKSVLLI